MSQNKKNSLAGKVPFLIFCAFVILILLSILIHFRTSAKLQQPDAHFALVTVSPTIPIKPRFLSNPTPVTKVASEDIFYTSTSTLLPLFSVLIPKDAEYIQDVEPLTIKTKSGLSIVLCTTCQMFILGCGGLTDGNVEEGGCAIDQVQLSGNLTIGSHYHPSEPEKILGSYVNYKNSAGDTVSIRVTTKDNRRLTPNDREVLARIISSLK
jgi:hypothetical protein